MLSSPINTSFDFDGVYVMMVQMNLRFVLHLVAAYSCFEIIQLIRGTQFQVSTCVSIQLLQQMRQCEAQVDEALWHERAIILATIILQTIPLMIFLCPSSMIA